MSYQWDIRDMNTINGPIASTHDRIIARQIARIWSSSDSTVRPIVIDSRTNDWDSEWYEGSLISGVVGA